MLQFSLSEWICVYKLFAFLPLHFLAIVFQLLLCPLKCSNTMVQKMVFSKDYSNEN